MYITVMDYGTSTITKLVWDVESVDTEEIEVLLDYIGYKISQIAYMVTDDEPEYGGCIEISDIIQDLQ